MKKSYTVAGVFPVFDHPPGETFSAEIPPEQEAQLIANGNLVLADGDAAAKEEKVPCPACVEQELARPPKFDDLKALQKHYADKHPALVPPETLPQPEAKKEE